MQNPSNTPERSPIIELAETAWREIEATLGLKEPDIAVRRDIARYVDEHLFELGFPRLKISVLRKRIARLRADAHRLMVDLDWKALEDEDEDDDAAAQIFAVLAILSARKQDELLNLLKGMITRADKRLVQLPKSNTRDVVYWGLVADLATLYHHVTNMSPTITYNDYGRPDDPRHYNSDGNVGIYESPFLNFVDAVQRAFVPPARVKGNSALGKQIERVLQEWRKEESGRTRQRSNC